MTRRGRPTDHEGRAIDFGRQAVDYGRHRPGFPGEFFERLRRRGWAVPGQVALDLGTGTGSVALGLASLGLEVTGIDISPELLERARQTAKDRALHVRFMRRRAEATGQEDDSADLVTAGQCWWWFDAEAAVREAKRVLRPGGRLLICNFSYLPLPGNVAQRTEDLILQHNPGWPMAGWRGVHAEQVRALDYGEFKGVESFSYVIDVPFTHESWRGRVRTCNGVGAALGPAEVDRFDAELAQLLRAEYAPELRIPHRIFATSGVLSGAEAGGMSGLY